jgi:DNA-binding LytR/AlgR family response regulator
MKSEVKNDAKKETLAQTADQPAKPAPSLDIAEQESFVHEPSKNSEPVADRNIFYKDDLIRLFYKRGEFVYARPDDIVMIESSDHLINIYIVHEDKIKKTVRTNSLKDFHAQLPGNQFLRIGRFCIINLKRLSGGNCKEQSFEFDFKVSIKLKHAIPPSWFSDIGK